MKILVVFAATLLLLPAVADAQMYRCERGGQTIISDKPCPKKAPVGDVDPTKPARRNNNQPAPLILDVPEPPAGSSLSAGVPDDLSGAGAVCRQYHRAMVSGDKRTMKNLVVASKVDDIDRIPASSLSAMTKVIPATIDVDRIDGDPSTGRALVKLRGTTGTTKPGYCSVAQEDGRWKVLRQDWN